jgi:predicted Na+-dependent transporter
MYATTIFLFLVQPLLLALGIDAWLGDRRPSGLPVIAGLMAAGILGLALVGAPTAALVDHVAGGSVGLDLIVVLTVAILTFAFLTGVWMARVGGGLVGSLRR